MKFIEALIVIFILLTLIISIVQKKSIQYVLGEMSCYAKYEFADGWNNYIDKKETEK